MSQRFSSRLIKKEKVAKNTYSFYFEKGHFKFLPGQYLRMTLDIKNPDERGSSRFFTISSSPLEKYLVITTRIIRSTFKKRLFALEEGEEVTLFGPLGKFILEEKDLSPKVFISAGMGITPFHSMISYANKKKLKIPISLIASFSNGLEMIFGSELTQISKENKFIKVNFTIRKLTAEILRKQIDNKAFDFLIVGPPGMVEQIKEILVSIGVENQNIGTEDFTGY